MIKRQIFSLTTDGSGDAVAGHGITPQQAVFGELVAIKYVPGTIETGATLTVTCQSNGDTKPLLTQANAGTSTIWKYPRDLVHAVLDGAALTGTSGGDREKPLLDGYPKAVIASGANSKTGSVILYYEE